jgi:CRP-like cAMP-binding protein
MALKDDIALLTEVPLFQDLDEDKLRLIAFGAERRRVLEGQTLFREGTNGDCGFVVAAGRFGLVRKGRKGPMELGTAERGTLLGEIAMISAVERRMTAIAAEPSEVMRINRPLFHRMLEEYPEIAGMVEERVRSNFAALLADLERLGPKFRA